MVVGLAAEAESVIIVAAAAATIDFATDVVVVVGSPPPIAIAVGLSSADSASRSAVGLLQD